jgi:hypothetical protein
MLVPLFLENHPFLIIQQDRLRDAERFRRARLLAANHPRRVAGIGVAPSSTKTSSTRAP